MKKRRTFMAVKKQGVFFLMLLAVVIAGGLAVGQWYGERKADS